MNVNRLARPLVIASILVLLSPALATSSEGTLTVYAGEGVIQCERYYLHAGGQCDSTNRPSTATFLPISGPARGTVTFTWEPVSESADELAGRVGQANCACFNEMQQVGQPGFTMPFDIAADDKSPLVITLNGKRHCELKTGFPLLTMECDGLPRFIENQHYQYRVEVWSPATG